MRHWPAVSIYLTQTHMKIIDRINSYIGLPVFLLNPDSDKTWRGAPQKYQGSSIGSSSNPRPNPSQQRATSYTAPAFRANEPSTQNKENITAAMRHWPAVYTDTNKPTR